MRKYDNKTLNQIKRIVTNYNKRVDRIAKQDIYGNAFIPSKVSINELKEISSKVELNRRLRDLQSYNKKSAEQVVTKSGKSLSLYEYNLNKKYRDILRRDINKKIKFYESNYGQTRGVKETITLARSGNRDYLNLIAKKKRLLNKDIFESDYETLRANTKVKDVSAWQNNYITMLTDIADKFGVNNTDKIIKNIEKLTPREFNEFSKVERLIQQIVYYYDAISDVGMDYASQNYYADIQNLFDVLNDDIERLVSEVK